MRSEDEKLRILSLHEGGSGYKQIAKKLGLSRDTVRGICLKRKVSNPKKRGRKSLITKPSKLRIKRRLSYLKDQCQKVTCRKIINECDLNISRFTMGRYMKKINQRYKKIKKRICLKDGDKEKRVNFAKLHLSENHPWEQTVFSDEKWFSLDGPDDWRTYVGKNENPFRPRRQKKGGGVMVWAMMLPNGLLTYKILDREFKSNDYMELVSKTVVPISKLNLGNRLFFQHDNSRIHTAKKVKDLAKKINLKILDWPARSPDLNIIENVWKMMDDIIYDRSIFNSKEDLINEIKKTFLHFNQSRRSSIISLYQSYRSRLCKVLEMKGNQINI